MEVNQLGTCLQYAVGSGQTLKLTYARGGIGVARHYPTPPHLSRAYEPLRLGRGEFPVAEVLSKELLSIPLYPGIREDQLEAVVRAITRYFAVGRRR